jgi:hypothetical protein
MKLKVPRDSTIIKIRHLKLAAPLASPPLGPDPQPLISSGKW